MKTCNDRTHTKWLFIFGLTTILFLSGLSSCQKLIEVEPPINAIVGKEIYKSNNSAATVLTGIYSSISEGNFATGRFSISVLTGLSSDELTVSPDLNQIDILFSLYRNSLTNNVNAIGLWSNIYGFVFRVNSAIEGISTSKDVTEPVRSQLLGEAKFLRAFFYFYLVNLYGDVPLLTNTDISKNSLAPRVSKSEVYKQIIADLIDAQSSLSSNYLGADATSTSSEKLRPNKTVATALLSRVYLFNGEWAKAEAQSSLIINNSSYELMPNLSGVFDKNSKETLWALQPTNFFNKTDGRLFILTSGPNAGDNPVYLSNILINSFEPGDNRKLTWIKQFKTGTIVYNYAFKYRDNSIDASMPEYNIVFRLAEQYLIRAEARAMLGKISGSNSAQTDLNVIRKRANLLDIYPDTEMSIIECIMKERRSELFAEWGHRWFDLKRVNEVNAVMSVVTPLKGGSWNSNWQLYPIPILDIQRNPNLRGHQNPGYPEQ